MKSEVALDHLPIEEIVAALNGPLEGRAGSATSLREQIERAARDLDRSAAQECGKELADCLFQDRPSLGEFEALVILALAHPRVARRLDFSVVGEGRRLAQLLDREGRIERARELLEVLAERAPDDRDVQQDLASVMRRTGGVASFIDRCITRAEAEARGGNYMAAISALQEVLLHDQSRRDVARMIRDLRHEEQAVRTRRRTRSRTVLLLLMLAATFAFIAWRDVEVRREYEALPVTIHQDVGSLHVRMAALDALVERHTFWSGYFEATAERDRLQRQVHGLESRASEKRREETRQRGQRQAMAETARLKGLDAVERGDMREALQYLRSALELCPDDWRHEERVSADVTAIERWLEGQRK